MYEQPKIIEQRHIYLHRYVADKKSVVFFDETWANSHDGKDLAWVEEDMIPWGKWVEKGHAVDYPWGRWAGFPVSLSSFAPRRTQATTMMRWLGTILRSGLIIGCSKISLLVVLSLWTMPYIIHDDWKRYHVKSWTKINGLQEGYFISSQSLDIRGIFNHTRATYSTVLA